jgi:hypothetical protein
MRNLTLADLRLVLADMLDNRADVLKSTQTGKLYGPILAAKRKALENLPDPGASVPHTVVEDINAVDAQHDGLGAAIWHYTEAVLGHPTISAELRDAARRVREAFIPDLGALRDSFADEAAAAAQNRPKLEKLAEDLRRFATPDGKTLHDWVAAFLDQGDKLARLLSARVPATGFEAFRQNTALRVTTIGLLGRFRAALADEMAEHPQKPRDLDAKIFGFVDEVSQKRA